MTNEEFCRIESIISGEHITDITKLKYPSFSGIEFKEHLDKFIDVFFSKNKNIDADKYLEKFQLLNLPNIFDNTRKRDVVKFRHLFCTILRIKVGMTFQEIADWFTSKGKDYKKHETIIHAVNKTLEENYYQDQEVAEVYDMFIADKADKRKKNDEYREKTKIQELLIKQRDEDNILWELVKDVPKDKQQEIYDMVSLRIKSWEWKNKDNVKTYNCNGYALNN